MILSPVASPCRIAQHFGANPQDYEKYGINGHDGVDVTGPLPGVSVPTYAPYDGTITVMTGKPGWTAYGTCVVIRTAPDSQGMRREIVLGHHASLGVRDGQWVHMGDPIGMMGATGSATGLHVHIGLRYLLPDGSIANFSNGYHGWTNFEPYLLFWKKAPDGMVTYPYG